MSQSDNLTAALKAARVRKGWSQRALSLKAGIPQTHISKIERNEVDIRLSTLIELARLLDLDPMLVPRAALTGVQAIIRESDGAAAIQVTRRLINSLQPILQELRSTRPVAGMTDKLATAINELHLIAPMFQAPGALAALEEAVSAVRTATMEGDRTERLINLADAIDALARLRSAMVHTRHASQTPAYSLDDED